PDRNNWPPPRQIRPRRARLEFADNPGRRFALGATQPPHSATRLSAGVRKAGRKAVATLDYDWFCRSEPRASSNSPSVQGRPARRKLTSAAHLDLRPVFPAVE